MAQIDITYILNARWPTVRAYGLQVAKVCQGFKQVGAKVRLVVPHRAEYEETKGQDPYSWYGIRDKFRVVRIPSFDVLRMGFMGQGAFLVQQAIFGLCSALYLWLRPSEIVYSRDPFVLFFLSFVRRGLYWEMHRVPERLDRYMYRRLFRRVAGIVSITRGIQERLVAHGILADRILVAPDGIDLEDFIESKPGAVPGSTKKLVVYTGQLLEWKGVDTLIDAAQLIDDSFEVVIVGGKEAEINHLKKRDALGRVRFEGFIPHDQAVAWMQKADVLVLPNRKDGGVSEFYTSPMKMFEYMASGRPIVASDLPSLREVLTDTNAILVAPDDAAALVRGIELACTEDGQRRAQQARADVEQYTWKRRAQRVQGFLSLRR